MADEPPFDPDPWPAHGPWADWLERHADEPPSDCDDEPYTCVCGDIIPGDWPYCETCAAIYDTGASNG